MADKSLARALKRKIGLDESILEKIEARSVEESLLMNPSRRRIFEHVYNCPGSHLRAISRATDFSPQNVRWHLRKLMAKGLLTESSRGKKKTYTPLNSVLKAEECTILALLTGKDTRRVYLFIEKRPRTTQREMVRTLNIYQQKLSRILLSLEHSALITHEKIHRTKAYSVTGKAQELQNAFDHRGKGIIRELLAALEDDGLKPKIKRSGSNSIWIQLNIGEGEQPILKVHKNPLKALLGRSR